MSRKDYIAIAAILRTMPDDALRAEVAERFATLLKRDNAAFDRARFLAAVRGSA